MSNSALENIIRALAGSALVRDVQQLHRFLTSPPVQQAVDEKLLWPMRQFARAADHALAPLRTPEFASRLARVLEGARHLQVWVDEAPQQLQAALADAGTIPHPELTLHDLATVIGTYQQHGQEAAVTRLQVLHDHLFADESFRQALNNRWQASKRRAVLEQILRAHDAGLYSVSIPTALAQAEGIVVDATQHTGQLNLKQLRAYLTGLRKERRLDGPSVEQFVADFLFQKFSHGDPLPPFSRHAILHGADFAYGTMEKSLRVLVWVDYLLVLSEESESVKSASPSVGEAV